MNTGPSVTVQLIDGGSTLHLEGALVECQLFCKGVLRYCFMVGRTDSQGALSFSFDDIERIRRRRGLESLMDYNTPLEDCDSTVKIVVPSQERLRQQTQQALASYGAVPDWAVPWPSNGECEKAAWVALNNGDNLAKVEVGQCGS